MNLVEKVFGKMMEFNRYSDQCQTCCCFYANLPDDIDEWIKEAMETEMCTNGQRCESNEPCWCYIKVGKE